MKILVLPGDGIGPEITEATLAVLTAVDEQLGLGLEFEIRDIGLASLVETGTTLPDAVMERIPQVDGVLLGPVSHYEYPTRTEGGINPSAELRTVFELFANIRPCRSRPGLSVLRHPMDLVIVRENTEGFYSDRSMYAGAGEFMPDPDLALSLRKISAKACERVARRAFELARDRRKKVTAVHKANVLKLSDGLFLREVRRVGADFPDVELEELIVDAAAALLARRPERFDVVVTTNMFGDILSDEASELSGGLGLGGSINAGHDVCVAQAQHGSAPDIAGQGIANPTSLILSAAMLLDWRGRRDGNPDLVEAAELITRAVDTTLDDPATRTRDVGGTLGTAAFADAVRRNLASSKAGPSLDSPPCCGTFPPSVLRPAELTAFSRGGGASTVPLVTRARGAAVFLSGQTLFEGGAGIPLHVHNCPESVVVLEGNAVAEIDGQEHALTTFDTTYVDADVPHRFRNASDTEPMRILWTYASVDATRTVIETGVTTRVDAEHDRSE